MPLSPALPKWLTETPDPSAIIGRGSAAGGQAADARLAAERLMSQQNQFAQEIALRQAAEERLAQREAAAEAARQEELQIRRTLAESEIAKEGRMAAATMMTAQQKARAAADALALQYKIEDNKRTNFQLERDLKNTLQAAKLTADEKRDKERNAATIKAAEIRADAPKSETTKERLQRQLRGAKAALKNAESGEDPLAVLNVGELKAKVVDLEAQLDEPEKKDDLPKISTQEEYNRLPKGAEYIAPDGSHRRKP